MSNKLWFHKTTTRVEGEELLQKASIDGSFLVRPSGSIPGAFAISLFFKNTIHTYRARPTDDGMLSIQTSKGLQSRKYWTIDDLVESNREVRGLVCGLTNPIGPIDLPPPIPSLPYLPPQTLSASTSLPSPFPNELFPDFNNDMINSPQTSRSSSLYPINSGKMDQQGPPLPSRELLNSGRICDQIVPTTQESKLLQILFQRFDSMQHLESNVGVRFKEDVNNYLNGNCWKSDVDAITSGGSQCAQLQSLLAKEAVCLQSELKLFLEKIDYLRVVLDTSALPIMSTRLTNKKDNCDFELQDLLSRLGDCGQVVQNLNRTVQQTIFKELGLSLKRQRKFSKPKIYEQVPLMSQRTFEVKIEGALKVTQTKLEVDVQRGSFRFFKAENAQTFYHNNVLQIIKNNKAKSKLSIILEDKKKDLVFEDNIQREIFCQLMQQIRNLHLKTSDPDQVSIFCGTWNMGNALPPNDLATWILCSGSGRCLDPSMHTIPHDIYVFGTQESGMSEKDLTRKITESLSDCFFDKHNFHVVITASLWQMRIFLIVKEEHKHRISHVKTSVVKTGIANTLGNKGAVGISFQFGGSSFCFINSHLTSGAEKCQRRNNNYHDILRELNLSGDNSKQFYFTNRFEYVFFFGDLNYRLNLPVAEINTAIREKRLSYLQDYDQLKLEKNASKVFTGFNEAEILFPPTYRYERGTREGYSHLKIKKTGIKINVPSWCDRVLLKNYPEVYSITRAYGCTDDIVTSDHSPVFSSFNVGVKTQFVPKEGVGIEKQEKAEIILSAVEVYIKISKTKRLFSLIFFSDCLTGSVRSEINSGIDVISETQLQLRWSNLAPLKPIVSDLEYLNDQHLLIGIRSEDESEILGECIVSLRSAGSNQKVPFKALLFHKEEKVGEINGDICISCSRTSKRREKTYEFIQIGRPAKEEQNQFPAVTKQLSNPQAQNQPFTRHVHTNYPSPTFPRFPESSSVEPTPPSDFQDLLAQIGMDSYFDSLANFGWDDIDFIKDITEEDLMDSGIVSEYDRRIILERIRKL